MKKNIVWVVVVLLVLGGVGYYVMNKNSATMPAEVSNQEMVTEEKQMSTESSLNQKALQVVPTESKVTYEIDEHLRGTPTHVVGTSQSLAGVVNLDTINNSVTSAVVKLAAGSFKTDIGARDENVSNLIFKIKEAGHDSITFTSTSIVGLPANPEMEKEYDVTLTGDTMISGITKPVVFTGKAHFDADGSFHVKATSNVTYGDFGLVIPDFPFLSNVSKVAKISVELMAR